MKTLRNVLVLTAGMLLSFALFQSCDNDDNSDLFYPNALVTAKTATDQTFYLQLNEETTLLPTNLKKSPFGGKEVRALVNYREEAGDAAPYSKAIYVNWIDSILTKPTMPNLFDKNDSVYGNDPVEIVKDWVTIAEDGYLTLRFRTYWGPYMRPHRVNLLVNPQGENPYEIEFRHNANNDLMGHVGDALVAFNLKDLPDTQGKTVKLKLKWRSFSGMKSAEFNYCSRKETKGQLIHGNESNFSKTIE